MSRVVGVFVALVALLAVAPPAQAAFPGQNGKIAFTSDRDGDYEIYVMNPDGSGQTALTSNTIRDASPAWSPDGTKIAFIRAGRELWVMDADGQNPRVLLTGTTVHIRESQLSWSPDGQQIAFTEHADTTNLVAVNADGTGFRNITNTSEQHEEDPAWSPSGSEIAFEHRQCEDDSETCNEGSNIQTIKPDGTGIRPVTSALDQAESHFLPDWSPTGGRIVFTGCISQSDFCDWFYIYLIDPDGTDRSRVPNTEGFGGAAFSPDGQKLVHSNGDIYVDGTRLTTSPAFDGQPDWQPIPINSYARPKSANWNRVSLVPAFKQCTAPNRTHGPPLDSGSCAPPQRSSSALTVGTPDANGAPVSASGHVIYEAQAGNGMTTADEADVNLRATIKDVRNAGTLSDYGGALSVATGLRVTDKNNTPHPGGPGAATASDGSLAFDVPCTATADPDVGSTCSVVTSADAVLAGMVKERVRSVWQLGRVEVYDGTDTLFMTQGVFVP